MRMISSQSIKTNGTLKLSAEIICHYQLICQTIISLQRSGLLLLVTKETNKKLWMSSNFWLTISLKLLSSFKLLVHKEPIFNKELANHSWSELGTFWSKTKLQKVISGQYWKKQTTLTLISFYYSKFSASGGMKNQFWLSLKSNQVS